MLTYLFFELEKKFSIRIDANKLVDYKLNTINGIVSVVLADS